MSTVKSYNFRTTLNLKYKQTKIVKEKRRVTLRDIMKAS